MATEEKDIGKNTLAFLLAFTRVVHPHLDLDEPHHAIAVQLNPPPPPPPALA